MTDAVLRTQNRDQRNDGHGNGGGGDRHLRGHRGHRHRPFRANAFFQGDIRDNGKHGIDDVTGPAEEGQHPGGKRCEKGDVLGVFTQQALCELHHYIQATGGL